MIDIDKRVKEAYKESSIGYLVYKDVPWFKRLDLILVVLCVPIIIILVYLETHYDIDFLSVGGLCLLCIASIWKLNHFRNSKLSEIIKKDISAKYEDPYSKEQVAVHRVKTFWVLLIEKKVLTGNKKEDTRILRELIDYFKGQSSRFFDKGGLFLGGSAFLLFLVPVWIEFVKQSIEKAVLQEHLDKAYVQIIAYLFLIFVLICFLYVLKKLHHQVNNASSFRFGNIAQLLDKLRINLKLNHTWEKPERYK